MTIQKSIDNLFKYIENERFKGYDPYDSLNSSINFKKFGKWIPILITQLQKRNPIHIRPLLGIKKEINPKAFGLFINAFAKQYHLSGDKKYLDLCSEFFEWLKENKSPGYQNACWGYNFDWASPLKLVPANTPSVVSTAFIVKGLFHYYQITRNDEIKSLILSAARYVYYDLPRYKNENGTCISYTDIQMDVCHNANLLGAEVLSYAYYLDGKQEYKQLAEESLKFTMACQKENGRWNYSIDIKTGKERAQIDFHQGYVIESASAIIHFCELGNQFNNQIENGLRFYINEQFFSDGRSLWRIPKIYPVEIHNQSQGIITFIKHKDYNPVYANFAYKIAKWTIQNMQDVEGYFYYQKHRFYTIKIPYMRWSQAWMFLALTDLQFYSK